MSSENGKRIESFVARNREPFGWHKAAKAQIRATGPSRLTTSAQQPPKPASPQASNGKAK